MCTARSIRKDRFDVSNLIIRRFGFRSRLTGVVTLVMGHLTFPSCCSDVWPAFRLGISLENARQEKHKVPQGQVKVHLPVQAAALPAPANTDREWAAAGANHPLRSPA